MCGRSNFELGAKQAVGVGRDGAGSPDGRWTEPRLNRVECKKCSWRTDERFKARVSRPWFVEDGRFPL